ncbi:hypothetical protein EYF80_064566 [Liparis tanakae]|uniref:Uncharacterized protein n=1 Tax=Liparis tanakae TaxID=230148 RepID=A0A4Z2E963_9TELE|nr:hypothetical protein EYF80_064566 [Liparis tanakae]
MLVLSPVRQTVPGPAGSAAGLRSWFRTHQRLLPHREHGGVGLQVDPGAAAHGPQPLHRDVLRVPQTQAHQVQHAVLSAAHCTRRNTACRKLFTSTTATAALRPRYHTPFAHGCLVEAVRVQAARGLHVARVLVKLSLTPGAHYECECSS